MEKIPDVKKNTVDIEFEKKEVVEEKQISKEIKADVALPIAPNKTQLRNTTAKASLASAKSAVS